MKRCLCALALALSLTACGGARPAGPAFAVHPHAKPVRWVGTHGIEVAVPAAWRLGRGFCGTPKANTVLWNEDGVLTCLTRQPPGLSVVEFGGILRRPHGWYKRHTTAITVAGGARALQWHAGRVDGGHEVQLVFPSRGISVTILSPHRALLRQMLASVRAVRVDSNGCATRPAPAYRQGSRASARQGFVPEGARRVIGCSYKGRWLDRSNLVGRSAARRLARALDAAPYGFSHARRGSILPSACVSTWRNSLIIARFEYAGSGRPVALAAHLDGCSRLGASNGRWAIRLRPAWVGQLITAANYAGDYLPSAE